MSCPASAANSWPSARRSRDTFSAGTLCAQLGYIGQGGQVGKLGKLDAQGKSTRQIHKANPWGREGECSATALLITAPGTCPGPGLGMEESEELWQACHDASPDFSDGEPSRRFRSDVEVLPPSALFPACGPVRVPGTCPSALDSPAARAPRPTSAPRFPAPGRARASARGGGTGAARGVERLLPSSRA